MHTCYQFKGCTFHCVHQYVVGCEFRADIETIIPSIYVIIYTHMFLQVVFSLLFVSAVFHKNQYYNH